MFAAKLTTLSVAAALAGAMSLAAIATPDAVAQVALKSGQVKCYGISAAGKNDCANQAGTHSCAGQSKVAFDGGEWKASASKDACVQAKGKTEPFKGANPDIKS